ncbi:MAG: phosphotransferase [Chloroflexota bacterium]|nr:phosphotransferase [Chloroflexota bacterium]
MQYHVVVARPEDGSILALPSSGGWCVPVFTPQTTDPRIVEHVNAEMRRQLGFEIWTLKCAARGEYNGEDWRIFMAIAREPAVAAQQNAMWIGQCEASSLKFAIPAINDAVAAWFAGIDSPSELRSPWETIGWHDSTCDWIRAELAARGIDVYAPIAQQRAWGISCTMLARTDAGDFYFKATPPFMAHEGRIMQAIGERCPQLLPAPIAADAERGWLLMPDYGSDMLHECADIARWEEALRVFAQTQVEQAAHAREWLALGCPDRRLGRMVELIDPLIASCSRMLAGGANGLSQEEVQALRSLSMPLKMMCARLAQLGIPHTLVHGDIGGNILMQEDGYTFFDWTDVCISHPFFDMATVSSTYFDVLVLDKIEDADRRLRDAYLEPWTAYEPMERLIEAFEASKPLGALHQAMSYVWIITNIAPDARPEPEGGLLHWTRNLLRLCGRAQ